MLVVFIVASCTEEIKIDLGTQSPELVVDGFINTEATTHTIYLKKTSDYFSNKQAEVITGAVVTLSDGTNTITLAEDSLVPGSYNTPSNYSGEVGKTYTLTISNVDVNADGVMEKYTASSTIPSKPQIDSMIIRKSENNMNNDIWDIDIWMQDPKGEKNCYLIKVYKNNICVTDSLQEWGYSSDVIYDGFYLQGESFARLSSNKPDEVVYNNDLISLELDGITEDYMNFISDAAQEYWGRNPLFGGQPSNIRTNVKQLEPTNGKNNPHGYFAAYSTNRVTKVYQE
jgi:hypothetical protein